MIGRTQQKMQRMIDNRLLGAATMVVLTTCLAFSSEVYAETAPINAVAVPDSTMAPAHAMGQTATLLPSGRWLLIGAFSTGEAGDDIAYADSLDTGPSALKLQVARTGHTTTVLPDGSLLVVGGTDRLGNMVSEAEIIDLSAATVRIASTNGLIPRTLHTATLLTDGRVLLAGGIDAHGASIAFSQLWSSANSSVDSWNPQLLNPRSEHSALLLANGEGLISGGHKIGVQASPPDELFNPSVNLFEATSASDPRIEAAKIAAELSPAVAETLPASEARDVPISAVIAIRFNQPLQMAQINSSTVTLVGPNGPVLAKVVGAEGGMIAFLTPATELAPGTLYSAFIQGITNASGRAIDFSAVRFTTHRFETTASNQSTVAPVSPGNPGSATVPTQLAAKPNLTPLSISSPLKLAAAPQATTPPKPEPGAKAALEDLNEDWTPQAANRHGQWRVLGLSGDPAVTASATSMTDLSAATGQTGLAGHVLRLNGKPLTGVAVSIGKISALTDGAGRFLLTQVSTGIQQLLVDGTGVTTRGWHYTKHYIQVNITAGQTKSLPAAVFLPRVNPATEINISSPTSDEIVLTHPSIPGLEVHIPKGVVLREYSGKVVTKLSITPVPVDRPPIPTPTNFSVYFSLQPVGAFVDADAAKAIKVIYPNYLGLAPGARVDFWNYDPNGAGWGVYAHGSVTADGKQVAPDPGVGFRQIMSFSFGIGQSGNPPAVGPPVAGCVTAADPVDCATGLFLHSETDVAIKDVIPISVTRTYRQLDTVSRAFGIGTNLSYAMSLYIANTSLTWNAQDVYLILPDGGRLHYALQSSSVWKNLDSPGAFYGSTMTIVSNSPFTPSGEAVVVTLLDHTVLNFNPTPPNQLVSIVDSNGNSVQIAYAGGNISQVVSPNHRYIQFTYDPSNRITMATDNIGRSVRYTYDTGGRLYQVTDQNSQVESFYYDALNRMTSRVDKRGNTVMTNTYDANSRVKKQTLADGALWQFAYTTNASNVVTATTITDPRGFVRQDTFNASGYLTQEILASGQSVAQTTTIQRASSNKISSVTDALGRQTTYAYDAYGNVSSSSQLANTVNQINYGFTYDPVYQKLASYTDPNGHLTQVALDGGGNPATITNAVNNSWTRANNAAGLPTSVTDPLGHAVQMGYQQADLSSITDALGRTVSFFPDGVGRVEVIADPLGNRVQMKYDPLDRVTQVTNPLNGKTVLTYDPNGNVLTVTDPRNAGQHSYAYDGRNRLHTYTDPLGKIETYNYDGLGKLTSKVDRKGQTTTFTYDALDRLQTVTYADASTVTVTWDAGNRPQTIVDSANGTITQTYDGLDRLTSEVSPQGQVSYQYDATGRRTVLTTTVSGNAQSVNYYYDNANRLTQIKNGSTVLLALGYDMANRRTSITYPNGVVTTTGFDAANEILSLSYDHGVTHIGDLAYTYDIGGRQSSESGSLAQFTTPATVAAMTYNAANRLTVIGSVTPTFDNNGNLLSNGSATYTWNARNQLIGTNAGSAIYNYDALGRRIKTTIGGVSTSYLHDGQNPVALNSTMFLEGPGLDEVYGKLAATGATSYLRDALGSTIAVSNSSATTTSSYAYSSYGNTTITGTADSPFQYTGREDDAATNLYYYRARYYSPQLGRFISEDPIGLKGGINTYAYVTGNPISNIDPLGLWDFPSLPQGVVNTSAGIGDALLLGFGAQLRNALNVNGGVDSCSASYKGGQIAGILGTFLTGEGEANLIFKTGHYAERLIAEGVDVGLAEAAVANEIRAMEAGLAEGENLGALSGRITVGGTPIQYNAFPLPGGQINIGTIFPVKW